MSETIFHILIALILAFDAFIRARALYRQEYPRRRTVTEPMDLICALIEVCLAVWAIARFI